MKNATINAVTAPDAPDEAGKVTYPADVAIAVRAYLTEVTTGQRIALGATIENATAVLAVRQADLPEGVAAPLKDRRVVVTIDGGAQQAFVVEDYKNLRKPGFEWHQAFLRKA